MTNSNLEDAINRYYESVEFRKTVSDDKVENLEKRVEALEVMLFNVMRML